MPTERVELDVQDGTHMPALVSRPEGTAVRGPGLLVLQDQHGVTPFLRDVAERFAALGCTAIAPALFHRSGAFAIDYDDPEDQAGFHNKQATFEGQIADAKAAYRWLVDEDGVDVKRIAAIGFCMGGRLAYLANASLRLRAAISFYGGRIAPNLLHYAPQQHGPLLFFWGGRDDVISKEQTRAVADGLDAAGATHDQVTFSHALHSFFCHTREEYDPRASAEAWAMSLALLRDRGVLADG